MDARAFREVADVVKGTLALGLLERELRRAADRPGLTAEVSVAEMRVLAACVESFPPRTRPVIREALGRGVESAEREAARPRPGNVARARMGGAV